MFAGGGISGSHTNLADQSCYSEASRENKTKILASLMDKTNPRFGYFNQGLSNVVADVLRENHKGLNIFYHHVDVYSGGMSERLRKAIARDKERLGFDPESPSFSLVSVESIAGKPTADPELPEYISHAVAVCCFQGEAIIFDNNAGDGQYGYKDAIEEVRLAYEKEGFIAKISDTRTTIVKDVCGYAAVEIISLLVKAYENGDDLKAIFKEGLSLDDPEETDSEKMKENIKKLQNFYQELLKYAPSTSLAPKDHVVPAGDGIEYDLER